jgi:hypothetical protein
MICPDEYSGQTLGRLSGPQPPPDGARTRQSAEGLWEAKRTNGRARGLSGHRRVPALPGAIRRLAHGSIPNPFELRRCQALVETPAGSVVGQPGPAAGTSHKTGWHFSVGPAAKPVDAAGHVDGVPDMVVHELAATPTDFGTAPPLTYRLIFSSPFGLDFSRFAGTAAQGCNGGGLRDRQ